MKNYKDILGNELKVKFGVGGFNNDITYCELFRKIQITPNVKIFGIKPKYVWKEVYSGITCDNLIEVSDWIEADYHLLAIKCINEYNEKEVCREKVKNITKNLNQI